MSKALLVSSPSKLEMDKVAGWIAKLVHRVEVRPHGHEWGIFVPQAALSRARAAFRRVLAATNPNGRFVVHAKTPGAPYRKAGRVYRKLWQAAQHADELVRRGATKAVVLGPRKRVRFTAFQMGPRPMASNPAKFLTAEDLKRLPPLYANEHVADPIAQVKFFQPWGAWTWYATEYDGQDTFFGLVQGHEEEQGYFSRRELESIRGPGGLRIERDLHFRPTPLSKLRKRAAGNPRGFVPIEVKGTTQAARVLKFLRKRGIRAKLRRGGKPGWFGFTCAPSEEKRAHALMDEWTRLADYDRPVSKALASEERWRRRQRRRPHRRGFRKGGYMLGGKTLPEGRSLPNPRRKAKVGTVIASPDTGLVYFSKDWWNDANTAFRRMSRHEIPGLYEHWTLVRDGSPEQRRLRKLFGDWPRSPGEFVTDMPGPRAYSNGRGRARRNPTMTNDEAWAALQWIVRNDKVLWHVLRRAAVKYIEATGWPKDQGIGSSDVNAAVVDLILRGDVPMPKGAPWRK